MSKHWSAHKIDCGKLAIVPIFSLLMIMNVFGIVQDLKVPADVSALKITTMIHRFLIISFYGLFVLLYLVRSSARSTTDSFAAKVIAVAATFLPFAIPAVSRPLDDPGIMLLADLVAISGLIITLYSLSALGRSLSLIPQARSLVRTGPYRIIRHPVYVGELIAILGIVLARFSYAALAIYCLLAALQIYRALHEERVLANAFPEYASYAVKKARFIPGIF